MTNLIGIHAGVWTGGWSPRETRMAFERTREAGYDLIELTATDPRQIDPSLVRELCARHGLIPTASLRP